MIMIIQTINEGFLDQATYGHIVEDIHHASQVPTVIFQFCHVKRSCNKVADALAKRAKNGLELQVGFEVLPEDLAPLALFYVH